MSAFFEQRIRPTELPCGAPPPGSVASIDEVGLRPDEPSIEEESVDEMRSAASKRLGAD